MKVKFGYDIATDLVSMMFYEERDGRRYIAQPVELVFEEVTRDGAIREPTLRLEYSSLKAIADALDEYEIKSDKDAKMEGLLEATRDHLKDMRKLVFKKPRG